MAANAFFIQHFLNFLSIYSFDLLFWVGLGLGWVWTAYSTQGCLFFNVAIHWPSNALAAILISMPVLLTCSCFYLVGYNIAYKLNTFGLFLSFTQFPQKSQMKFEQVVQSRKQSFDHVSGVMELTLHANRKYLQFSLSQNSFNFPVKYLKTKFF